MKTLWKNTLFMIRFSALRYVVTSFFIALLIGLLHIFVLVSVKSQEVGTQVKNSLGLYLYLKDDVGEGSDVIKRVTTFKEALTNQGLSMTFLSKDDALASLEKEMPHIQEQFTKYAIKNPLPSTLYIRFQDQQQFERLQQNIVQYEDLFQNFDISNIA